MCSIVGFGQRAPGVNPMAPEEPEHPQPAARDFRDRKDGLTLRIPAGWDLEQKDGVLSSFQKDVSAMRGPFHLRAVATLTYNPYAYSTFAGAAFYFSTLTHSNAQVCASQTKAPTAKAQSDVAIAGIPFNHGQDHHGMICTESRDDVFTTMRGGTCLRFDLVVNTFCSQTSGALELSPKQLGDIDTRLGGILQSIHVDGTARQ